MTRTIPGCSFGRDVHDGESGQASVLLIVILFALLMASLALAVDFSNMWFRRQAAQSAADASCVAGAMDMLYLHNGSITTSAGFIVGTAGDCNSSSSAAICQYAGFNGYTATTSAGGWNSSTPGGAVAVNWTFPNSVTGVRAPSGITNPFLKVVVQQNVQTWFMGLLGMRTLTVGASCTCGLPAGPPPAPLVILNPTIGSALTLSGGSHVVIIGGPKTSIQVNSSASNAVSCNGGNGYPIDTSTAGPSSNGGDLAIVGGPGTNQLCGANYILNNTSQAQWKSPSAPSSDPYGSVPAPTQPALAVQKAITPVATIAQGYTPASDPTYGYTSGTWVASGTDSCPNTAAQQHYLTYSSTYPFNSGNIYGNCLEFTPGYYPNGIDTTSLAGYANDVVIFMPGVYYLNGNLKVGSSTTIRNAWVGIQPSTQGVMFYFLTGGPLFSGGSGAASASINSVPSYYLNCSSSATPNGMPASLAGNVIVSQCSAGGTYVGAPNIDSYSASGLRGLLVFAGHSNTFNGVLIGAGASMAFSGSLYFHNAAYADLVELDGAGNSTTYGIGNIVVDQLTLSGSGTIRISLTGTSPPGLAEVSVFQ